MKIILVLTLILVITACSNIADLTTLRLEGMPAAGELGTVSDGSIDENRSNLQDLGRAPELTNQVWLNVQEPLRLADLRGHVVLLDMWTFG